MAVIEARPGQIEEALRQRAAGAAPREAAGTQPASAEVERLVTLADGVAGLAMGAADAGVRRRNRTAFDEEADGFRTAWVHNHSVAHKRSRHPGPTHRFRWTVVVAFAVFLALFTGVGLAFAAQLSDPDSQLYPVRLMSEKGLLAVSRNPVDRAAVHIDFANQRFRDTESMASRGKAQLALDALMAYHEELRAATNGLGSVKIRDRKWLDARNQLTGAEAKKIDIVETALVNSGHSDAAAIVAERQKAFNVERQTLDKQLVVEAPKPAAPAPAPPAG